MSDRQLEQYFERWVGYVIAEAASELRQDGWVVSGAEERPDWLPGSLRAFTPDFVARKGNEILVAEVKSRAPGELRDLDSLAKAVAAVPNARLEVYWLGDETTARLARKRVAEYADEARALLRTGHKAAALLIAWAAVEGGLFYYTADVRAPLPADPKYVQMAWLLLSHLDSLGYINEADLKRFGELRRQRNAAAHFSGPEHPPNEADIEYCLEVVDRMLRSQYSSVDQMEEWYTTHYEYPEQPVGEGDRARIRARVNGQFPGVPERDLTEVIALIVQDAAILSRDTEN
jgi:hypothetical protein